MNIPDHFSQGFETVFRVKKLKFFDADPGSGMEKFRIWDGKKSDPGSGINIPDPQHCPQCCFSEIAPLMPPPPPPPTQLAPAKILTPFHLS
jgi:hypothetical protein